MDDKALRFKVGNQRKLHESQINTNSVVNIYLSELTVALIRFKLLDLCTSLHNTKYQNAFSFGIIHNA